MCFVSGMTAILTGLWWFSPAISLVVGGISLLMLGYGVYRGDMEPATEPEQGAEDTSP